ncbi:MAG: hypothetical protein AVDCRST_MAG64-1893, partial [uncultured Phycisphaerae bacterium]
QRAHLRVRRRVRPLLQGTGREHRRPARHRLHDPPGHRVVRRRRRARRLHDGRRDGPRPPRLELRDGRPGREGRPEPAAALPEPLLAGRARLPGAAELRQGVRRLHDVLRAQRRHRVHQPDQGPGVHGHRQAGRRHAGQGRRQPVERHRARRQGRRRVHRPHPQGPGDGRGRQAARAEGPGAVPAVQLGGHGRADAVADQTGDLEARPQVGREDRAAAAGRARVPVHGHAGLV